MAFSGIPQLENTDMDDAADLLAVELLLCLAEDETAVAVEIAPDSAGWP